MNNNLTIYTNLLYQLDFVTANARISATLRGQRIGPVPSFIKINFLSFEGQQVYVPTKNGFPHILKKM